MQKQLENIFRGKKILVTGGTGCIGSEIVRSVLKYKPEVVRIFSNDEDNTFRMMHEIDNSGPKMMHEISDRRFLIGDIRDKERVLLAMEDIDIVYHAAALKHVPLCEYNPFEAIKTNVLGTKNVIEAALASGVNRVINISTDKAVNPVNTMGATKLLAEKLIIDANEGKGVKPTIFSSVRFGNVSFSRGSVIPLFEEQIRQKKPITITNPEMTRFMMLVSDTIELVFKATVLAKGGEVFILKMPVVRLGDLVDVIIEAYAEKYHHKKETIEKRIIGLRPGEKMFEELMTESEAAVGFETDDMLIIPPQLEMPSLSFGISDYPNARHCSLGRYSSRDVKPISKEEIKRLLFS
ncbi:MAG: polysaccharide biosynthesis protein [Thermoplasmata archaeon]|nr:polysaccharide biosynthesis protein [Thermoplasmata archaeon]MBE3140850.1 polysaccharide biosynthesis protein [Thermoplasmata archaeon]